MRHTWMAALVVASSMMGSTALADWEAPVVLSAEDDWEAPVAFAAEDDWEAPIGLTAEDDWESPIGLTGGGVAGAPCLRSAAVKWQPRDARDAVYIHGFWNVCGQEGAGGWESYELIDAAWWDSYISVKEGRSVYRTRVVKDAAGWHGQLYNFRLGAWEEKAFAGR
jgi:hypothetical protein